MTEKNSKNLKERDNIVYVGKKSLNDYVTAVMTQFGHGETEVLLKARGINIVKAVSVSQVLQNNVAMGVIEKDAKTGTDILESDTGTKPLRVSVLTIYLERK